MVDLGGMYIHRGTSATPWCWPVTDMCLSLNCKCLPVTVKPQLLGFCTYKMLAWTCNYFQTRKKMPHYPINQVPTWHHTHVLQYYWLYSSFCTEHPHGYSVITNLYLLILSPLLATPNSLLAGNHPNVSMGLFLSYLFIWFFRFRTQLKSHYICLCLTPLGILFWVPPCCCSWRDFTLF